MLDVTSSPLTYFMAVVQFTGLASACLARLGEGSSQQANSQRFFVGCLGLVGATSMVGLLLGPCPCLMSAGTLAVMVVGVLWAPGHQG